MQQVIACIL